mmetsp:Transcript_39395/g.83999  ORF Transcript_39395/g.83999 Transcript_39395/m.83999 type:complete len:319 (+) Transcript_39395:224-1180(+)
MGRGRQAAVVCFLDFNHFPRRNVVVGSCGLAIDGRHHEVGGELHDARHHLPRVGGARRVGVGVRVVAIRSGRASCLCCPTPRREVEHDADGANLGVVASVGESAEHRLRASHEGSERTPEVQNTGRGTNPLGHDLGLPVLPGSDHLLQLLGHGGLVLILELFSGACLPLFQHLCGHALELAGVVEGRLEGLFQPATQRCLGLVGISFPCQVALGESMVVRRGRSLGGTRPATMMEEMSVLRQVGCEVVQLILQHWRQLWHRIQRIEGASAGHGLPSVDRFDQVRDGTDDVSSTVRLFIGSVSATGGGQSVVLSLPKPN